MRTLPISLLAVVLASCSYPVDEWRVAQAVEWKDCSQYEQFEPPCPVVSAVDCFKGAIASCKEPRYLHQVFGESPDTVVTDFFFVPKDGHCAPTVWVTANGTTTHSECEHVEEDREAEATPCIRVLKGVGCKVIETF